jgi:hypothetical protein
MASEPSNVDDGVGEWQVGEVRTIGVSSEPRSDGGLHFRIERIELREVRLKGRHGSLSAVSATLTDVRVASEPRAPARSLLGALTDVSVGELKLEGAKLELPTAPAPREGAGRAAWRLDALGSLDGVLHVDVTDAAWIFDAKVTMPIAAGRVDFNRATVEHVGPDSSMGLSPMGLHVETPTGRTYLYRLTATQVPGARFEQRSGLLSPFGGDRGSIDLQPFVEGLLSGLALGAPAADMLPTLMRTGLQADIGLGDGAIAAGSDRVVLADRERGKNRLELSSAAGSRRIAIGVPAFAAGETHLERFGFSVSTGPVTAALGIQLTGPDSAESVSVVVDELTAQGIACRRSRPDRPGDVAAVAASDGPAAV